MGAWGSAWGGGGYVAGTAVDELVFTLSDPIQLSATLIAPEIIGGVTTNMLTGNIEIPELTQSIEPDTITSVEGC